MKRVTYPHLGMLHITTEYFIRSLGLVPATLPFSSRRTLALGVNHCPEMTCAPCKILFGNYYEGLELGADRLALFGGPDTCRLGYLAQPQADRLRDAGLQCTAHTLSLRGVAGDILRVAREVADPSPLEMVEAAQQMPEGVEAASVGVTGSARRLTGIVVGAVVVKTEITAHAVAAASLVPDLHTVFEINGQDSKLILLDEGIVTDCAMNSVCAAGAGSFLDQQAYRLNLAVEEPGPLALQSQHPVRIAGRRTVFAESDMVHKQQMGHLLEDILYGLCQALARNYLNNLAQGKELAPPVVFQGGVAANAGMVRAFEETLEMPVLVPPHSEVMGSIGAAMLAREHMGYHGDGTSSKGFSASEMDYTTRSFECQGCSNLCEVVEIRVGLDVLGRWGGRCGKWDM